MICPNCGFDNFPGSEECSKCTQDLTQLDRPVGQDKIERSLMDDSVGMLHPGEPITVLPTTSLGDAIKAMLKHDIGALLVVDTGGKLLGIFSERDLLGKVAAHNLDLSATPVHAYMTPKPEVISPSDSLAFALHKMDVGGYRHLPVIEEDKPVAVVSVRDMLRHITRMCKT
ncbi:MAG TPA: CBS domain-containing protein [Gemmataceae bacterium]|jgi:CBS domain-containing protein|nr:CBS domain-containing protein [Gemmataceae bacterium]